MSQPADVGGRVLIGRQRELGRIAAAFARPDCHGIALIGMAGVGKTRLADECRHLAEQSGMTVVVASANETSARLTLGALAHLLPPASNLADLHQDLQPAQLLQSARLALAQRAGDHPLVIFIDDAHYLDSVAAHLINHLAASGDVFVILTIRSGMAVPAAITSLWKDDIIDRLDLGELADDDIGPIAEQLLGGPLDLEAKSWLNRTSGGNALFLRELTLAGREDGSFVNDRAVWRLSPARRIASPRLIELLEQRLNGLPPDQLRAVHIIALAEPIGLEIIEELVGIDCLDALDQRGLVKVIADGKRLSIALTHPLYVEAIRRETMTIRKRADLTVVANAVLTRGARRREDAVRIAGWQLTRGGTADPEVLYRAGLAAVLNFDDHAALELTTAGLEQNLTPEMHVEFRICRGLARSRLGRYTPAAEDLQIASDLAVRPDQISRSGVLLAAAVLEATGKIELGKRILADAIGRLSGESEQLDLRLELATLLADAGQPIEADHELARIDAHSLTASQRVVRALALASSQLSAGRPLAALATADAGLHDHLSNLDVATTYHPSSHFPPRILGLIDLGRFASAIHESRWLIQRGQADRRLLSITGGQMLEALTLMRQGRARSALEAARHAIAEASEQLPAYMVRVLWAVCAEAHASLGDVPSAVAALHEFEQRNSSTAGFSAVESVLTPARVARAQGDTSRDEAALIAGVVDNLAVGNRRAAIAVLDELVHVHHSAPAARQLLEVTAGSENPFIEVLVIQARAVLSPLVEQPAIHASAAEKFQMYGMHLRAAEAAAYASELAGALGDQRARTRYEHLAATARAACEVPNSRATVGLGAVVMLTNRERDIALRVGRGDSSKEVAAALFLSVRTVDNHLQRIYSKLGVSSRKELRAAIGVHRFA